MSTLVTYSSLTGNTQKLAEGIFENLPTNNKTLLPIKEAAPKLAQNDVVLVGFWVDKGGPNEEAKALLQTLKNKKVGLFATLGFWSDSDHAWASLKKAEEFLDESNTVFARYICQGPISEKIIEQFKKLPPENPHAITPQKMRRYELAKKHPTPAEVTCASELFNDKMMAEELLDV